MVEQISLVFAGAILAIGFQLLVRSIRDLIVNNPKPRYRRKG
jgi:hypothetical protein